jgi:asparagine synthase (glutamine-hydrolysing)
VVRLARSDHHEVEPDPEAASADFARLCQAFSDPSFIGPHWLAWSATELAATRGVTHMMTGIDGDRVVSHGAGRFGDLASAHDYAGLWQELVATKDLSWSRRLRIAGVQSLLARLPERLSSALEGVDPRRQRRFRAQLELLRPEALARHDTLARLRQLPLRARSSRIEHLRSLQAADRNWDVELLEQLGAAFNVRFEQPFFDRRVLELCISFPGDQKRQQGWSRYVLRNAMRGVVPDSVLTRRTDTSFDHPYWSWARRWLSVHAPGGTDLSNLDCYIDVKKVGAELQSLPRWPTGRPVDFLWKCVILSRWLNAAGVR